AVRADGGARRGGAADVARALAVGQEVFEALLNKRPATHVLGFFLGPHELTRMRILCERFANALQWERIELLETNHGHIPLLGLLSRLDEIVIDLAAAQDNSLHGVAIADLGVVDQWLEAAVCEVINCR